MDQPIQQTRFNEDTKLPFTVRVISFWLYLLGINYFVVFISRLIYIKGTFELGSLATGFVFWWVASGLGKKINLFRVFSVVLAGVWLLLGVFLFWQILFGDLDSHIYYMGKPDSSETIKIWFLILWGLSMLMNFYSIVVLLLPNIKLIFNKSTTAKVNQ